MDIKQIKTKRISEILDTRDKYLAILKYEYAQKQKKGSDNELSKMRRLMMQLKYLEHDFHLNDVENLHDIKYAEPHYLSGFSKEKYDILVAKGHIYNM